MSETARVRVPTNRFSMSSNSDCGEPYRNQICGVKTLPADFEIFLPPLSKNISYLTCDGGSKHKTSRHMRSFMRTESAMSLPKASNRISKAFQRAANSPFQLSL